MMHMTHDELRAALISRMAKMDMSQTELARRSGIERTQINAWIHKPDRQITVNNLEALAAALDLSLELVEVSRAGRPSDETTRPQHARTSGQKRTRSRR